MRFLVDEDLPRSTSKLFQRCGHESIDVRDVGLRGAVDSKIASYAQRERLCLVTGDFDFSDIRNYSPNQYSGIIVLSLPKDATANFILNLLDRLLEQKEILPTLAGKLAIVDLANIRIRTG